MKRPKPGRGKAMARYVKKYRAKREAEHFESRRREREHARAT